MELQNSAPADIATAQSPATPFNCKSSLIISAFIALISSPVAAETPSGWVASRDYGKSDNTVTSRYTSAGLSPVELAGVSLEREIDIPFRLFDFRSSAEYLVYELYEYAPQDVSVELLRMCGAIFGSSFLTGDYDYEIDERNECVIQSAWDYGFLHFNFIIDKFKDGADDPPVDVVSFGLSNGTGSVVTPFLEINRGSLCGEAGDILMCWQCFTNFSYMIAGETGSVCKASVGEGSERDLVTAGVFMSWSTFALHWQAFRDEHGEDPQLAVTFVRKSGAQWHYRYQSNNLIDTLLLERQAYD